jgi:hypothetical protein
VARVDGNGPAAPAASTQPETVFVLASTLNLRAEPLPDARKLGRVWMNSPVRVVQVQGTWTRVRTANEKEGWVDSAFLGAEPIPLDVASAKAAAATDPAERLTWAQRAAAIAPDDPATLRVLAAAYRATGDAAAADTVEARAAWPEILPVVQPSAAAIEVELKVGDVSEGEKAVPAEAWTALGVDAGWTWWVLPDRGAAVSAQLQGVRWAYSNECGGTATLRAVLAARLPEGAVAVVATHGTPPASWREDAPPVDRAPMVARLREAARAAGGKEPRWALAPVVGGWHGRAVWPGPEKEDEMFPPQLGVDLRLRVDGGVVSSTRGTYDGLAPELPLTERDLDGDGKPETVWDNQCQTRVLGPDGGVRAETDFRCCGC